MKTLKRIFLVAGLAAGLFFILFATRLTLTSGQYIAKADPKLAHMYNPLATFTILTAIALAVTFCLAIYLVLRSLKNNIIEGKTVSVLNWMGHSCLAAFLLSVGAFLYSTSQIGHEVGLTGGYMIIFMGIFFTGAMMLYFISQIISDAAAYRAENELTV